MNRLLFLILFLLQIFATSAQTYPGKIVKSKAVIGKISDTGESIYADIVNFDAHIYHVDTDEKYNTALVQLRNHKRGRSELQDAGYMVLFCFEEDEARWWRRLHYNQHYVVKAGNRIIQNGQSRSHHLDARNGETLRISRNKVFYIDRDFNIALAYRSRPNSSIFGINLDDGSVLWKEKFRGTPLVVESAFNNDSTVLLIGDGIYEVNLLSGISWYKHAKLNHNTHFNNSQIAPIILANMFGIMLGIFTGYYFFTIPTSPNQILSYAGLAYDELAFYCSSGEYLLKVNRESPHSFWQRKLPKKTGIAFIFTDYESLFVINRGFVFVNNEAVHYGQPYIFSADKVTGANNYLTEIKNDDILIIDYLTNYSDIVLLMNDRLQKYSILEGNLICEIVFMDYDSISISEFREDLFLFTEFGFDPVSSVYPHHFIIGTTNGEVIIVRHDLTDYFRIDPDDIFKLDYSYYGIDYYQNKDKLFLSADNTNILAEINVSDRYFISGNQLYDISESKLFRLDLGVFN